MKSLKNAILSEMKAARKELRNCDAYSLEKAVHSFRRRCKRMRAYLRLMPSDQAKQADHACKQVRQAAGLLSELRDSQVSNRLLRRMQEQGPTSTVRPMEADEGSKPSDKTPEITSFGAARVILASALKKLGKGEKTVKSIRACQSRVQVLAKLVDTHKETRRAIQIVTIRSSPEGFHELRKKVKQFYYQCQFIKSAYGLQLDVDIDHARTLADKLGDAMDIAVFSDKLRKADADKISLKVAAIDESHEAMGKLFHESLLLACQLFFETSKNFKKRVA